MPERHDSDVGRSEWFVKDTFGNSVHTVRTRIPNGRFKELTAVVLEAVGYSFIPN
jgi:hypothetical protein